MKKIPIGIDNFKTLVEKNYYLIDKSMFIRDIWEDTEIVLITRPRRFGKTLNMSMLKYFFDLTEDTDERKVNNRLFKNLKIYKDKEMMELQGRFPVIFLSFRGCSGETLEETKGLIIDELKREIFRFKYLEEHLDELYKTRLKEIMEINIKSPEIIKKSIFNLSELITRALGVKPILLIDEYDNPINNSYIQGFYKELINFMKPFYENSLKSNNYIEKAVMTGILRVSKESIFSGLNNLNVNTIFSNRYSDKFGFLEDEVEEFLNYYNIDYKIDEVKDYYNGYTFGKSQIFNPWSIIKYCEYMQGYGGMSKDFWINTSSNDIIRTLMENNSRKNKKDVEKLIKGETIVKDIDENIAFKILGKQRKFSLEFNAF